jgi:transcriptional regulator with XRE-family HTH domain
MTSDAEYKRLLGLSIRSKREAAGISARKFALMIGVHRNYINDIESGAANPSIDILWKIADGLDVDVKDLMDFDS